MKINDQKIDHLLNILKNLSELNIMTVSENGSTLSLVDYYSEDRVELRFKLKFSRFNYEKLNEIARLAKMLKEFVFRNDYPLSYSSVTANFKIKKIEDTYQNCKGKVYAIALRSLALFFYCDDDKNSISKATKLISRLNFNHFYRFKEIKKGIEKERFYLETNELLGSGGFHKVFRGYDIIRGRDIAVRKIIDEDVDYFDQIKLHVNLSKIKLPGIVRVYSICRQQKTSFLERFSSNLYRCQTAYFNNQQILSAIFQIFQIVKTLHDRNLAIRDVKPNNFLYKVKGEKICIAIADLETLTEANSPLEHVGTYLYLPIDAFNLLEQADLKKIDCWSLGLTILTFLVNSPLSSSINPLYFSFRFTEKLIMQTDELSILAFEKELCHFLKDVERKHPDIRQSKDYVSIKECLKSTVKLSRKSESDRLAASKIINLVLKQTIYYKKWIKHYKKLLSKLEQISHPLAKIVLGLMDLDVEKRWDVNKALEELNVFMCHSSDSKEALSSPFKKLT